MAATGGQLGANKLRVDHTGTPVVLTVGAVADGELLQRSGTTVVGIASGSVGGGSHYDTIVPDDYALPSAALAAGHTNIWVRSGSYTETSAIPVTTTTTIDCEDPATVSIDFSTNANTGFHVTPTFYRAGTISILAGSNQVTGSGTSFTSFTTSHVLLLDGVLYGIQTISSNTLMYLTSGYRSPNNLTGYAHWAVIPRVVFSINNCTITGRSGSFPGGLGTLVLSGAVQVNVDNVRFVLPTATTYTQHIYFDGPVAQANIRNCSFVGGSVQVDITPTASGDTYMLGQKNFEGCRFLGAADYAIDLDDLPDYYSPAAVLRVENCVFTACTNSIFWKGYGRFLLNDSSFVDCTNALDIRDNSSLTDGSTIRVSNCTFQSNTRGLLVDGTGFKRLDIAGCTFVDCTNCVFASNTAGEIIRLRGCDFNEANSNIFATTGSAPITFSLHDCQFVQATDFGAPCAFFACHFHADAYFGGDNTLVTGCFFVTQAGFGGVNSSILSSEVRSVAANDYGIIAYNSADGFQCVGNRVVNSASTSTCILIDATSGGPSNIKVASNVLVLNSGASIENTAAVALNNDGDNLTV